MHPHPLFFCRHTPPSAIYTLSLHDALPICRHRAHARDVQGERYAPRRQGAALMPAWMSADLAIQASYFVTAVDRKSTRLNSSHLGISYAVFCLKKKKKEQ